MKNCVLKGFGVLKLNKEIVLLRRREVYKGENGNIEERFMKIDEKILNGRN